MKQDPQCEVIKTNGKQCRKKGNWRSNGRPLCQTHALALYNGAKLQLKAAS